MKRSALLQSSLCIGALLCVVAATSAQELVTNGGFETGGLDPWTVNDSSSSTNIGPTQSLSYSGIYHANLGAFGTTGSLSQALATTPGESYNLVFALANDANGGVSTFGVYWSGILVFPILTNSASFPYTLFTVNNLTATSSSTTLDFQYRNEDDYFRLDDVSVSAVPEATTISLTLLGLGLTAVAIRGRSKRQPTA